MGAQKVKVLTQTVMHKLTIAPINPHSRVRWVNTKNILQLNRTPLFWYEFRVKLAPEFTIKKTGNYLRKFT